MNAHVHGIAMVRPIEDKVSLQIKRHDWQQSATVWRNRKRCILAMEEAVGQAWTGLSLRAGGRRARVLLNSCALFEKGAWPVFSTER